MVEPLTNVQIVGERELRAAFRRLGLSIQDLKDAHKESADIVVAEAQRKVPVRTGRLRDSIRGTGQQRRAVVRAGTARVPYAGPIHFGWPRRNIRPQPFLYDALDARGDEVMRAYERNIGRLIRRAGL